MNAAEQVYAYLNSIGIAYESARHPAVMTIADCAPIDRKLNAVTAKNYFLCTKNQKHFYLCIVRPNARFHTADISKQVNSSRLSFAGAEYLERYLRVYPGAVSPMGLIFDTEMCVRLLVDSALRGVERLAFHPCDNSATLAMRGADFFSRFLPAVGHAPQFVEIHDFLSQT